MIPSSNNPLVNASRAIAVSAYPNPKDHVRGGKAEKYSSALLAFIVRISKKTGHISDLPAWAREIRWDSMERHLVTGHRNLMRALTIRDLINSALTMKEQYEAHKRGESRGFVMQYSEDLNLVTLQFPITPTTKGFVLSGRVPDTALASLRAAILYHRQALERFQGPAVKEDGRDPEGDYQNAYTRYVRPALFAQHVVQVVWEQITDKQKEADEREISISGLLMMQPDWAADIQAKTADGLATAIYNMRKLGVPTCWCEMVRFVKPTTDS